MSPERICLFFTNFPLGVSQWNANFIAVFRYNATLSTSFNTMRTLPPVIDFFVMSHCTQPISCLDDPIKTTTFILTFYSSNDS